MDILLEQTFEESVVSLDMPKAFKKSLLADYGLLEMYLNFNNSDRALLVKSRIIINLNESYDKFIELNKFVHAEAMLHLMEHVARKH